MRSRSFSQLLGWRWAPCAALVLGSLTFVALALLLIPDRLGGAPTASHGLAALTQPEVPGERQAAPAHPKPLLTTEAPRITRQPSTAAAVAVDAPTAATDPASDDAPTAATDPGSDDATTTNEPSYLSDPSERHARRRLRPADAPHTPVAELPPPAPAPDPAAPTN